MLITIDLEHPDNDVEVVGLREGETLEARLGPKGFAAYRIFGASARLLFLSLQKLDKPDIAAATEMMVERESDFIRQRLNDLRGGGESGSPPPRGQRPPDRRNGQHRGRR
jgi:hypothetical protein